MPFVKLDCGILNSTLWFERTAREIFITALLMAEPFDTAESLPQIAIGSLDYTGWSVPPGWYGFVPAASVGILHRAGVSEGPEGLAALASLGEPDASSRSTEFEGRRLIRVDGGFVVLNFMRYRERDYTSAERSRRYRDKKREEALEQHTRAEVVPHRSATVPHRDRSSSHRDITQAEAEAEAEAERRREERAALRADAHATPPVLTFPVVGQKGPTWDLSQAQIDAWQQSYPDVDILAECRKALAWVQANRRKTARGMPRFLVAWLNRATNASSSRPVPAHTSVEPEPEAFYDPSICRHPEPRCAHRVMCGIRSDIEARKATSR